MEENKDQLTPEDAFRHKLIAELHDIALSLQVLSERNIKQEKKGSYKDFYFGNRE